MRTAIGETAVADEYQNRFQNLTVDFPTLLQAQQDTGQPDQALEDTSREMPTIMPPANELPDNHETPTLAGPDAVIDDFVVDTDAVPGYDLLGELGRGGMGVVYKARDQNLKRTVALKMILSGAHASDEDMQRFQIEAEAVAKLQHPNIVQIYEVSEHEGRPYIALEFADGGSLDEKVAGKPQDQQESAELIETLAGAMQLAHENDIIHRDLKPANILLTTEGVPRITDFGLAKRMDEDSNQTKSGAVMGTPSYMAPEQAGGKSDILGPATDTYALGAILYHMLTGRPPFQAATQLDTIMQVLTEEPVAPRKLNPALAVDLETICLKCLEKDAHRRYESAEALGEDLRRFQSGEPILARPVTVVERSCKWAKRRPAVAGMISVIALALVSLIAGGLWYNAQLKKERDYSKENRILAELRANESERARKRAILAEKQALENLRIAEQNAYGSDMLLIQNDWESNNIARLRELLSRYQNRDDLKGFEWDYWDRFVNEGMIIKETTDHPAAKSIRFPLIPPHDLRYSRDGTEILYTATDKNHTIRIWGLRADTEFLSLSGHSAQVDDLAFTPDNTKIVSCSGGDGTVRVWNGKTGVQQFKFDVRGARPPIYVRRVAISPDGKFIAGAGMDDPRTDDEENVLTVWDTDTGKIVCSIQDPALDGTVWQVAFSPDGSSVIDFRRGANVGSGVLTLWDIRSGEVAWRVKPLELDPKRQIEFSALGKTFLTAEVSPSSLTLRDAKTGKELWSRINGGYSSSVSPDGHRFGYSSGGSVSVGQMKDGKMRMAHNFDNATLLAFNPNGKHFVSGKQDGTIREWHVESMQVPFLAGHTAQVSQILFSSDGKQVFSSSLDGTVRIWDVATTKVIAVLKGSREPVWKFAISPDQSRLVTAEGARDGRQTIRVWDIRSRRELFKIDSHARPLVSLAFSNDGKRLLTAERDWIPTVDRIAISGVDTKLRGRCIYVWNSNDGQLIRSLPVFGGIEREYFNSVTISPDGEHFLVTTGIVTNSPADGPENGLVQIRSIKEGTVSRTLHGHRGPVKIALFSPDGQRIVTAGVDNTIRIWDFVTAKELFTLRGSTLPIVSVAISPDGKRVACAHLHSIIIWDAMNGSEMLKVGPFGSLDHRVGSVIFSPDGRRLAASSGTFQSTDNTIRIWDARPLEETTDE